MEDESRIDVDATTSASVLAPGNAARIAGWIQERTGGDLFSIRQACPTPQSYWNRLVYPVQKWKGRRKP